MGVDMLSDACILFLGFFVHFVVHNVIAKSEEKCKHCCCGANNSDKDSFQYLFYDAMYNGFTLQRYPVEGTDLVNAKLILG